ncbi:MAG: hypothetical protein NVS9B1_11190 [Candidatus Dormibacteraceae bacterium]
MPDGDPDLERRLDAMFASARPRAGFEGELWTRLERRQPWRRRLAAAFSPWVRLAPAVATVLVLVLAGGWLAQNFHPAGGGASTASSAGAGGAAKAGAFGALPRPAGGAILARTPAAALRGPALSQPATATAPATDGVGVAMPLLPALAPVYRYDEPTPAARADAARRLSDRTGLVVRVDPSRAAEGVEPRFVFDGAVRGIAAPTLAAAADDFLDRHQLRPAFVTEVRVEALAGTVTYVRQFGGAGSPAPQVRPAGGPAGLEVRFRAGTVIEASGPLDLPLATADYPLLSAPAILAAAATGSARFDHAELVYVLVFAGGHGYYEPAVLFTGAALKVIVPAIDPAFFAIAARP